MDGIASLYSTVLTHSLNDIGSSGWYSFNIYDTVLTHSLTLDRVDGITILHSTVLSILTTIILTIENVILFFLVTGAWLKMETYYYIENRNK